MEKIHYSTIILIYSKTLLKLMSHNKYLLDQYPELLKLIESNESLTDYDTMDLVSFFSDGFEDFRSNFKANSDGCFFYLSTNTMELCVSFATNTPIETEWFQEVYYNMLELLADFYNELYDKSIHVIQSGYSEGVKVCTGVYWDSLDDSEKDCF